MTAETEARRALHAALCKIRDDGADEPHQGICFHILRLDGYGIIYDALRGLIRRWPDGAKDKVYPIEGSEDCFHSEKAAVNRYNPAHPWGARRLALLDWMIEETKP